MNSEFAIRKKHVRKHEEIKHTVFHSTMKILPQFIFSSQSQVGMRDTVETIQVKGSADATPKYVTLAYTD